MPSPPASEFYIREKLSVALDTLATGASPIQRRLGDAAISALERLKPEDFPSDESRELFEEIMAALRTRGAVGDRGAFEVSAAALDDEAAEEVARKIVELHHRYWPY